MHASNDSYKSNVDKEAEQVKSNEELKTALEHQRQALQAAK